MKVTVKYFGALKQDLCHTAEEVMLAPGATVSDLLAAIGIEKDEIGILVVSGKSATFSQRLRENDSVTLIPHIGGG